MNEDDLQEEEIKVRQLRLLVDLAGAALAHSDLSLQDSLALLEDTKKAVLQIFPDKESVYNLIYTPRFRRIIRERFVIPGTLAGRN